MRNCCIASRVPQSIGDLEMAAGIGGGDHLGPGFFDMADLPLQQLGRHLGLGDIVNPGAAAAPCRFAEFRQLQAGDGLEDIAGLFGDLLAVAEMAGLVVGHFAGSLGRLGFAQADEVEPLVDVLELFGPGGSAIPIRRIFRQQPAIGFQVRTAACRVGDDGVIVGGIDQVEHPPGEETRGVGLAVVGVEGTAAG